MVERLDEAKKIKKLDELNLSKEDVIKMTLEILKEYKSLMDYLKDK